RNGVQLEVPVIIGPADRSFWSGLRLIALAYLGIGIYVLFRRWTAPKSTHFYIFCLVSAVSYAFHYTGKLNLFDWIIFWGNIAAWVLFDSYRKAQNPILRQQFKWITRGTVLAVAPYALFFVVPYLRSPEITPGMKFSSLFLIFLPLTLGYAIVRYRLMDVDLI